MYSLPRKGLRLAHININSLRNKINEVAELLNKFKIHILAISETHLDSSFDDTELYIEGYNIYRNDRNGFGGGVAFYILSHLPVKLRTDLMSFDIETLWLQMHLPHRKPTLLCCCYRPPSANYEYLDSMCKMLDMNTNASQDIYFMGDLNIDWFAKDCHLKRKLLTTTNACGLTQLINKPTRICFKNDGSRTSTCIDHIFTNRPELCKKILSIPTGSSDHNLIISALTAKLSGSGNAVLLKRSYKLFKNDKFIEDVQAICWSDVLAASNPETALFIFNKLFLSLIDKHAPLKKFTVRNKVTPWLDDELKKSMQIRCQMKRTAVNTGNKCDWDLYRKMRNSVAKLNKKKKKIYFENHVKIIESYGMF